MTLFDIPFINGYKSAIGGYGLLLIGLAGVLITGADFLIALGNCLTGELTLHQCVQQNQATMLALIAAFKGLGDIGIAHKIEKASAK